MLDKVLVFDLDATLYYVGDEIEKLCDIEVCQYFVDKLGIDTNRAQQLLKELRQRYYYEAKGVDEEFSFPKHEFMERACDVDVSIIPADSELADILKSIPNPKYILTDSTNNHVLATLNQLRIDIANFISVFDAHDMQYTFKHTPKGYQMFLQKFALNPNECIMFEDSINNLRVAKDLGFTTVFINHENQKVPAFVDYHFQDIKTALRYLF